jgi:hypothetical protein
MRSSKTVIIAGSENWQQQAAHFLLHSGFKPGEAIGLVEHVSGSSGVGRTFGSVWREMRSQLERDTKGASGNFQGAAVDTPLLNGAGSAARAK